ncbi:hypothetical protein NMB33_06365 [Burkholderia sp. FXe9]|nr:hypothetical protein NMB33_06365 [Burkholderia sp. FXe9]
MKRAFAGSVPKEFSNPEANEDVLAFSDDGRRFALSDGASDSFNSKLWANLLANKYLDEPGLSEEWIGKALADYAVAHDFASMSWSKQAAFERGSFATLLGGEFFPSIMRWNCWPLATVLRCCSMPANWSAPGLSMLQSDFKSDHLCCRRSHGTTISWRAGILGRGT